MQVSLGVIAAPLPEMAGARRQNGGDSQHGAWPAVTRAEPVSSIARLGLDVDCGKRIACSSPELSMMLLQLVHQLVPEVPDVNHDSPVFNGLVAVPRYKFPTSVAAAGFQKFVTAAVGHIVPNK
jgi:hypothetical protein